MSGTQKPGGAHATMGTKVLTVQFRNPSVCCSIHLQRMLASQTGIMMQKAAQY